MMDLKDKHIGLAVTGSFCTLAKVYKEAVRLKEAGAELYPIFSEKVQLTDTRFGTAAYWREQFETLVRPSSDHDSGGSRADRSAE